jgi:hypothetical protein
MQSIYIEDNGVGFGSAGAPGHRSGQGLALHGTLMAVVGPLKDPVRNLWVVEFGMIACVLVVPLALICGPLRGIPFFWRLIDCSFGVLGILPLWLCRRAILEIRRREMEGQT